MIFEEVGKGIDLYPTIGMYLLSESIRVNCGQESFKYAIDEHVRAQHNVD